jgi:hypothetical protein
MGKLIDILLESLSSKGREKGKYMEGAMESHNTAHDGELINLLVDEERATPPLKALSMDLDNVTLSDCAVCDLELLMNGRFSPGGIHEAG